MPLIWNDYQYLFVDIEDEYDKNQFVIVRKLFITLNYEEPDSQVSITL